MLIEIVKLRNALQEKRSDIADILSAIIDGEEWSVEDIQSRYVIANIEDGTEVEYDTLTTLISYRKPRKLEAEKWVEAKDHEYNED